MPLPKEMRSVTVHPTQPITTTITNVAVPQILAPDEVLIKVQAAASNPKDWLHLFMLGVSLNSGDDLAGTVVGMGSEVSKFRIGDRVAAFHALGQPYGAYAEYAVAPGHTVFAIPGDMGFEEASTIPLVSLTAAITLFRRQGFAAPWDLDLGPDQACADKNKNKKPLLLYGATTALGTYIVKLAKMAGIGPIIAIGGGSSEYVHSLLDLDEQDIFLDYRPGMEQVKKEVSGYAKRYNLKLLNSIDAFTENKTWVDVSQMLDAGILSVFSSANSYDESGVPDNVQIMYTYVGTGHEGAYKPGMPKQATPEEAVGDVDFAGKFFHWVGNMCREGKFSGHPFDVVPHGLHGVADGLNRLKDGQARGKKLVYIVS